MWGSDTSVAPLGPPRVHHGSGAIAEPPPARMETSRGRRTGGRGTSRPRIDRRLGRPLPLLPSPLQPGHLQLCRAGRDGEPAHRRVPLRHQHARCHGLHPARGSGLGGDGLPARASCRSTGSRRGSTGATRWWTSCSSASWRSSEWPSWSSARRSSSGGSGRTRRPQCSWGPAAHPGRGRSGRSGSAISPSPSAARARGTSRPRTPPPGHGRPDAARCAPRRGRTPGVVRCAPPSAPAARQLGGGAARPPRDREPLVS